MIKDNLYLGIDLSTKNIGIAYKVKDKTTLHTITLKKWSKNTLTENIDTLEEYFSGLKSKYFGINYDVYVGIELSNFKNAKLTQRFSFYAGVIYAILYLFAKDIKMFNSNEWQRFICSPQDKREIRKQKSMEFCKQHNLSPKNDDEADAFCIMYFLPKLRDELDIKKNTKQKKLIKQQKQQQKIKLINKKASILTKIYKLDKEKNNKQIKRLEKELKEIEKLLKV